MPGQIEIKIQEHLDQKWKDRFEGMTIKYDENQTIIEGVLKDQSHLHGILNLIRDLNLKLISVIVCETGSISKSTSWF
jgi:phosphopantothenoylcysteine synthetase/decarboxylase